MDDKRAERIEQKLDVVIDILMMMNQPKTKKQSTEPKAERQDLIDILTAYHMKKKFVEPYEVWAKHDFRIWVKSAKQLVMKFNGNTDRAIICLDILGTVYDNKGLDWNLNTVVKNASEYLKGKEHDIRKSREFNTEVFNG
jgi:hypothetical protein